MSALRPCPFCGHDAELFSDVEGHWQVACLNDATCELTPVSWAYETQTKAIAAWNRREPDWQAKWEGLVETVASRTDQAKGAK